MVREVVVGDGNPRRPHDCIDEAVRAVRQRAMIDPDVLSAENGDPVPVRLRAPAVVRRAGADIGLAPGYAVVDVDVVDDYIANILKGDAGAPRDVDVHAPPIDSLEAVDDQLLLQPYEHIARKGDPQGLGLDRGVAQSARGGVHRVAVGGVCDHVDLPVPPSQRPRPEPDPAVRQVLAFRLPVRVAPPAVVDRVSRQTGRRRRRRRYQLPPLP